MGRVVETHAEYYNSRVPKKKRKHTLVDELLDDAQFQQYVLYVLQIFQVVFISLSYIP